MIYWLRIIFVCVMSLFAYQGISEEISPVCNTSTCAETLFPTNEGNDILLVESTTDNYLIRTINHILKSGYADLSVPMCAIVAGSKDNNDYKYTLHLSGTLLKGSNSDTYHNIYSQTHRYSHNPVHLPKDYYIYTLERIVI